jgi:hypothetical protein
MEKLCFQIKKKERKEKDGGVSMLQAPVVYTAFFSLIYSLNTSIALNGGKLWNAFNEGKGVLLIGNSSELNNYTSSSTTELWENFDFLNYYANPKIHCN